jgi:pimeloyl-ACP methyl ester carboxylesterase
VALSPLAFARAGTGPPLVFLPGLGLDRAVWAEVAALLQDDYDTIRLDLRGHGASPQASAPFAHHDDVAHTLDALGIARAHVAGLSLGGSVALDLALAHPARVRSLALVDSALGGFAWSPEWTEAFRAVRAVGRERGAFAARRAWAAHPLFATAPRGALRALLANDAGIRWTTPPLARPLEPPAAGRLAEVRVPTLVVVGERDLPDFHAIAAALAAGIPGARTVRIAGAGHLTPLESPGMVADTLRGFLADAPG